MPDVAMYALAADPWSSSDRPLRGGLYLDLGPKRLTAGGFAMNSTLSH